MRPRVLLGSLGLLCLLGAGRLDAACDTSAEFTALQAEIVNSPNAPTNACIAPFLVAGEPTDGTQVAACLNTVRTGNVVPDTAVPRRALLLALDMNEYSTMTLQQQNGIALLIGGFETFDLSNATVRAQLTRLFPQTTNASFPNLVAAPTTRAAIGQLQTRDGSRGETICGTGTSVTAANVATAFGR
jgi:hypothetical protein